MTNQFTFQKALFNTSLNLWGVDQYESEQGQIKLVLTNSNSGDTDSIIQFDSEEKLEQWLDSVVSEQDYYYNKARALACVISKLDGEFEFGLEEF